MNKRMSILLILVFVIIGLAGCLTPDPVKTKPEDAKSLVNSIEYVKAKNGLCFGVSSVRRMSTNGAMAENQMLVVVDCEKVGL